MGWYASALTLCHNINTHQTAMSKAMLRLSTGKRITSAADDPAGLCISQGMESQIRGMNVAKRNIQDAVSMIQTADGALGSVHSILQKLNELAVQSATGTTTDEDRKNSNEVFKSLVEGLDDICRESEFNTQKLFSTDEKINIQVGANAGQIMTIEKKKIDSSTLGLDKLDISTEEGASKAIDTIKKAISSVSSQRSMLGAMENRLECTSDYLDNSILNLTEAQSRIMDADMAEEIMNFARESLLSQVSNFLLSSYIKQQESMLQLLLSLSNR
ncbi:MAG: flagellin [Clostridium sp.]|uniref:flagellin n=1 Tax=Clostridium sp. DSM 8431 TaxID=1761781 RepID=UPI0008EAB900|nr:flagellin [Clostridium sp. DSM 8431]MCR4942875.1 flagellin [Clostridium sp.]SFU83480.1 flagellin [Clostridium sp. DSM 8431]